MIIPSTATRMTHEYLKIIHQWLDLKNVNFLYFGRGMYKLTNKAHIIVYSPVGDHRELF